MKEKRPRLWLTYAWTDNANRDVDFVAQQLEAVGLEVKLDRWDIVVGQRLWDQIATNITNPKQSAAWAIYATPSSLGSEPCQEEAAYALDRALRQRGMAFPIIGIVPTHVDFSILPPLLRTRLCASLRDEGWAEAIRAGVLGQPPSAARTSVSPVYHQVVSNGTGGGYVEARPRAGSWRQPFACVPSAEHTQMLQMCTGALGNPPTMLAVRGIAPVRSPDGLWSGTSIQDEASSTSSLSVFFATFPSRLQVGGIGHRENMIIELTAGIGKLSASKPT